MKKIILFLLLIPFLSFGQTANGTETKANAFRALSPQTVTSPTFLTTTGTDGTQGKSSNVVNQLNSANNSGILSFDGLAVNTDPTKYDIGAGVGYVMNSLTGVSTKVTWTAQTAQTTPYLLTSVATYVLKDNAGLTVLQNSAPTPQQYRTHIYLGKLAHTTFTTILFAVSEPSRMFDTTGQVSDINKFLGSGNIEGNAITYNGANLNINASAGMTYRPGANYLNDRNSPSITTETSFTAGTFRNKFRNGSGGWSAVNTTTIDPNYYDDGTGILAVVPNNKWTIKVFWRFGGTGTIHCDYGQTVYDSKAQALEAVGKAVTAEDPETKRDASKRGWLVVKQGITVLNDITTAEFLQADKFGERASGGSSTATMQTAYNNSVTPQITTSTGLGAVSFKRGSAADTDNVLVVQNGSGSDTFSVKGNGDTSVFGLLAGFNGNFSSSMQAASFNVPGGTSSQFLKADGSVDSNVYATNSSVVHLSGTETISGNKTFTGQNTFTAASSSTAITATASTSGNGITVNNNSNGNGFTVNNNSTGVGEIINSATASTSDLTRWQKNGTTTSKVDHNGNITGVSFIKSGATAGNILLAGGTDIAQSTFATATGGTGYIQNQNASAQSANFNITGTNSYIGTANFYNSPTSLYPAFFKNAATSFNIKGITDQDINIINQGTGMTTISGGWGLGFKADVAGTSNGPDYGVGVAGINYRPPTESMTKNFLLIRAGQYVFEDDNADWQMIITPTGVNIGGGATPVGGAVPVNKFEVDGNACIGENYDRVYSAPPNGLIVEGSSGFGTYTPSTNFITEFASASSLGFPNTSGSAQTGGTLRIRNAGSDAVLDIGNNSGSGAWLQSTNRGNLSSNYPLLFNPNGGNVLIGTTTDNGNKLRVNGTGYFDGGVSIPLSNSYSINGGRFVFHNGTTYLGDVDNISPGSSTIIRSGGSDAISITSAGVTRISSLAGTGTRTVVADASGNLAASTIVTSGTYTPTLTNTANITASSLTNATYTRIGDIVTVNIGFSVDPTAANTNTVLTITLPIARTVSTVLNSGSGAIFQSNTRLPANFQTSANTTQGVIYMYPSSTGTYGGSVTFQYNLN